MSLAAQIEELEAELHQYQSELHQYQSETGRLNDSLAAADYRIMDLDHDCEEMGKFIEYVDATYPELRTAYEAAKILKGDKP